MTKQAKIWDCMDSCRSESHANALTRVIASDCAKSDARIASFLYDTCRNFARIADSSGRTALHVAASTGRKSLVEWLVTKAGADINAKDAESGYTALQRSIYFGHLDVAVTLIRLGCDLGSLDHENLSAVSFLKNEPHLFIPPSPHQNTQLYVCGLNQNYTLGTGTDDAKKVPELSDHFRKNSISIKKVYLEEFHSVFIDSKKHVWVCGSGRGGRLGVGGEKSILIPQLLNLADECESAAVSLNHTLLLLTNGTVLAFGANTHHQLGVTPYIEFVYRPRHVNLNQAIRLFGPIEGVYTSKYHSVFYNKKAVFFCGRHESDQKVNGTNLITVPVQISNVRPNDEILRVASCENYVAYALKSGDVFMFNRQTFTTKKILSKQFNIIKILIGTDPLHTDEVRLILLDSFGTVNFWQGHLWPHALKCTYSVKRSFFVTDIFLNDERLLFVSKTGEAFTGTFRVRDRVVLHRDIANAKVVEPTFSVEITATQVPHVHSVTSLFSDPKGKNFAIVQEHPLNNLTVIPEMERNVFVDQFKRFLEETSPTDDLHDLVLKVKDRHFAAHRYILESRGCHLSDVNGEVIVLKNAHPEFVADCLVYLYTGRSELTRLGPCDQRFLDIAPNPLKEFELTLKKLGASEVAESLKSLSFKNGFICSTTNKPAASSSSSVKFDRSQFQELCDVDLVTDDGRTIGAHKCILAARVDYFNSMFTGGWSESKKRQTLKLPCNFRIACYLLDFIYQEDTNVSFGAEDVKIVSRLLIMADQFLINDLKLFCECLLVQLLDLKNCADILQLAATFNGLEIKDCVMEFIALNVDAVLESRLLETLDEQLLFDLAKYFRKRHEIVYGKRDVSSNFNSYEVFHPLNSSLPDFPIVDDHPEKPNDSSFSTPPPQSSAHKKRTKKYSPPSTFPAVTGSPSLVVERRLSVAAAAEEVTSSSPPPVVTGVTKTAPVVVATAEQDEDLFGECDFPDLLLSSPPQSFGTSPKSPGGPRKPFFPSAKKLSQKQKKKLSLEESTVDTKSSCDDNKKPVKGWAIIEPPPTTVAIDFKSPRSANDRRFQAEATVSPDMGTSPNVNFADVIANEQQKRTNWIKMKSKPFHLTQFEDEAITALLEFYNVDNVFDERIMVRRVVSSNIAQPTWIPSHR